MSDSQSGSIHATVFMAFWGCVELRGSVFVAALLRRHVGQGAGHLAAAPRVLQAGARLQVRLRLTGLVLALEQRGQAEVHHLRVAIVIDEDVGRLEVAVQQPLAIRTPGSSAYHTGFDGGFS